MLSYSKLRDCEDEVRKTLTKGFGQSLWSLLHRCLLWTPPKRMHGGLLPGECLVNSCQENCCCTPANEMMGPGNFRFRSGHSGSLGADRSLGTWALIQNRTQPHTCRQAATMGAMCSRSACIFPRMQDRSLPYRSHQAATEGQGSLCRACGFAS